MFDIEVKVYWDCNINSSTNPLPDVNELRFYFLSSNDPATQVGNNGTILLQLEELGEVIDTVTREGDCSFLPKFACQKYGIYRGAVFLPFSFEGYYLATDFGNRVEIIDNIRFARPDDGPVLTAEIHSRALLFCESSAQFKDIQHHYFCINEPIDFDASILQSDFDSVAYFFFHPYFNTWPDPPFNEARFEDGFRLSNLMGSPDPLAIDSRTGRITGTPARQGIFIIPVSIRQYNNNQLSGVLFREFIMYVGDCGSLSADFGHEDFYCEPYRNEVLFDQITVNFLSTKWILGDLENPIRTYTSHRPIVSFPHFGEFILTRIVYGNEPACNDTVTKIIEIRKDEVGAYTEIEWGECSGDSIEFTIRAGSALLPLKDLDFELGVHYGTQTYLVKDTILNFKVAGRYSILPTVRVYDEDVCATFDLEHFQTGWVFNGGYKNSYFLCEGSITLDDHFDDRNINHHFDWIPRTGILNNEWDIQTPTVSPDTSTTFTGTASLENCSADFTYHIEVFKPDWPFLPDTICGRQYQVTYNPFDGFARNYVWRFYQNGIRVGSRIDTFPLISLPNYGNAIIELEPFGFDGLNCPDTIVQEVYFFEPSVDWDIDLDILECSDSISLIISGSSNGVFIGKEEYILISNYSDTIVSTSPEFQINTPLMETIEFTLLLLTDRGCMIEESFALPTPYIPGLSSVDSITACLGDTVMLYFEIEDGMQIEWLTEAEFLGDPTSFPLGFPADSSRILTMEVDFRGCQYHYDFDVTVLEPALIPVDEILICDDDLYQEIDLFSILGSAPERWEIRDETGLLIDMGSDNLAVVDFPDFARYDLRVFYPSEDYFCGLLGQASVVLTESGRWNSEISVIEEECFGKSVKLHLFNNLIHNNEEDWIFQSRWVIIEGDTMAFSGDSLRVTLEGLNQLEILLEVNDQFGCESLVARSFEYQFLDVSPPFDSISICSGEHIELWPGAPLDLNYIWSPAEGLIGGITEPSPLAAPINNLTYSVKISGENCRDRHHLEVFVHPLPEIHEISANPETISPGEESYLLLSPGLNVADIFWSPPEELDNPHVFNPVARPSQSTLYTAYLISEEDCIDSAKVKVEVIDFSCEHPFVFLPSAFSPNGDGENDILYVRGQTILNSELIIYDRLGRQVFKADGVNRGWDGNVNGREAPSGVYAYSLWVECSNGETLRKNGNVSLFR